LQSGYYLTLSGSFDIYALSSVSLFEIHVLKLLGFLLLWIFLFELTSINVISFSIFLGLPLFLLGEFLVNGGIILLIVTVWDYRFCDCY
jgi:hypothetical protein